MTSTPFVVSDVESNLEYVRLADPERIPEYMSQIQEAEAKVREHGPELDDKHIKDIAARYVLRRSVKEAFEKSGIPVLVEDSFYSHSVLVRELRHYYSNERHIAIEGNYEVVGDHCFEHCPNIESLRFEEGVEQINECLFSPNEHLRCVELPYSLRSIGSFAFGACFALETVTFANPNTRIDPTAFENTKWFKSFTDEFVVINKQLLKYQGDSKIVSIPENVAEIGFRVFSENETIRTLICPPSLREIGTAAFSNCPKLCRVNLNEGLEIIGGMAFDNCPRLNRVTLPESLQILCCEAFQRYTELHYSSDNFSLAKHIEESYPYAVRIAGPKWNRQSIATLYDLCNQADVDLKAVEKHITHHQMTPEDITYVATILTVTNTGEVAGFAYDHERMPDSHELPTHSWVMLFTLFAKYGLQPNTIIKKDRDFENMMYNLRFIQNEGIAPAVMRILMECGGDPNLVVDGDSVFDEVDFDVTFGVVEQGNKMLFDNTFRTWLVLMGYGGRCRNGTLPVTMKDGYTVGIFKDYERFDYRIEWIENDWIMHIVDVQSGEEVAALE